MNNLSIYRETAQMHYWRCYVIWIVNNSLGFGKMQSAILFMDKIRNAAITFQLVNYKGTVLLIYVLISEKTGVSNITNKIGQFLLLHVHIYKFNL